MPRKRTPEPILGETPISSRDEARLNNRTYYFTGQLCVQGHLDWRWASTGQCRSCQNPPPKVTRYMGESVHNYTRVMMLRVKLLAAPEDDAQLRSLMTYVERAGREWAYSWALAKKPNLEID